MIEYGIDVIDPGRNMDHKQYSGSKAIEPGRNRDHEQYLGSEVFEVEPGRNRDCNVLVIPAREDEKS
jgi:hypothetical protein